MAASPRLVLLLPAGADFGAQRLPAPVAAVFGRADAGIAGEAGEGAQLQRHVEVLPRGWPVAAVTRQRDACDAAGAAWLRADPAWIRPDINGARLFGYGDALQLDADEAADLLRPLKPLFGDSGMPIDAPVAGRWYLRLPQGAPLPSFTSPDEALGTDLFEHLAEGPDARRWRTLLNEAQIVLHNHPRNAQRAARGLPPVNSLWFWGAGVLPDQVRMPAAHVLTRDDALAAMAAAAGAHAAVPAAFAVPGADTLVDLRSGRDLRQLAGEWLSPALEALQAGTLSSLVLDLADGRQLTLRRSQRWRVWRRSRASLS
ncbi:phosphoglycerate mutase [Luteimonas yindakuii]|uniref:Phosphoglycerate mutase n=1 Tax=Luteimonas yindakuii TaxID=2565782 RepID=A0A4Z1RB93_9GAMM|nr:phosphoglycerate mutase [Luteimonas yindakuii]TKS54038.1 phosphoglycerate mutase [Luteimonas yindakuii]